MLVYCDPHERTLTDVLSPTVQTGFCPLTNNCFLCCTALLFSPVSRLQVGVVCGDGLICDCRARPAGGDVRPFGDAELSV